MKIGCPYRWVACLLFAVAACGGDDEGRKPGKLGALTATTDLDDRVVLTWTIDGSSPDVVAIERDGVRIASMRGSVRSFEDRGAAPGSLGVPTLRAEGREGAVHLEWDPNQTAPGAEHTYAVVLEVDGGAIGRATATGARAAPLPSDYAILRDDVTIARVGWRTTSFEDAAAGAGTLDPPVDLAIEQTAAALVLGWKEGGSSPGPAHAYRVIALGRGG
ncbi:MAG TPA: hypothetical protein VGD74_02210, partial [Vulgatibacter sp.]